MYYILDCKDNHIFYMMANRIPIFFLCFYISFSIRLLIYRIYFFQYLYLNDLQY